MRHIQNLSLLVILPLMLILFFLRNVYISPDDTSPWSSTRLRLQNRIKLNFRVSLMWYYSSSGMFTSLLMISPLDPVPGSGFRIELSSTSGFLKKIELVPGNIVLSQMRNRFGSRKYWCIPEKKWICFRRYLFRK